MYCLCDNIFMCKYLCVTSIVYGFPFVWNAVAATVNCEIYLVLDLIFNGI